MRTALLCLPAALVVFTLHAAHAADRAADYVIAISIDGMGSAYVQPMMADGLLPNLSRMREEGASTLNARTDADFAITLPNHTSMTTGRGVKGPQGHHWTWNRNPKKGDNLATQRGDYTASMFGVAHDHGLSTAMWSGKSKFSLFNKSYNEKNGAPDETGEDNGTDKIDYAFVKKKTMAEPLTTDFISRMARKPANLAFVHFRDPDSAGHAHGWDTLPYREALMSVDQSVGMILAMIEQNPRMAGRTAVIVTADHGGHGEGHGDMDDLRDYMIPFLVWGAGAEHGDLYKMNPDTRKDPHAAMPPYDAPGQPVRNGEMGNLALDLLGLNAIPGSTLNAEQNLKTSAPAAQKQ